MHIAHDEMGAALFNTNPVGTRPDLGGVLRSNRYSVDLSCVIELTGNETNGVTIDDGDGIVATAPAVLTLVATKDVYPRSQGDSTRVVSV